MFLSARPPTDVSKVPTFIWVFNVFSKTVCACKPAGGSAATTANTANSALPLCASRTCPHTTKRPMVEPWPCALLDCFWQAVVASPSEATPRLEFGLDGCGYDLTQEGTHIVLHETASHASHGHGQRRHLSRLIPTAAEAAQRETWHVRTTVRVLPHGQHIIRFTPMEAPSGTRMFVLVNRFGASPHLTDTSSFTWCHSCVKTSAVAGLTVQIDASEWIWEDEEACIAFGFLHTDQLPPRVEPGCEMIGVECSAFTYDDASRILHRHADEKREIIRAEFVPEDAILPTQTLRHACCAYYRSFATVLGDALSGQYMKRKPPPPQWADSAAPGGSVIDSNFTSLTYGEAEFVPLYQLLCRSGGIAPGSVVVDIGSGTGRMVLCAALAFPDAKEVRGIELVPDLHRGAEDALSRLREQLTRQVAANEDADAIPCAPVTLHCADILDEESPWADADFVLATSLCFPAVLIARVQRKALSLRPGARILCMQPDFDDLSAYESNDHTVSTHDATTFAHSFRRVPVSNTEEPPHGLNMRMSFGEATFYVYERNADGEGGKGATLQMKDGSMPEVQELLTHSRANDGRTEWRFAQQT